MKGIYKATYCNGYMLDKLSPVAKCPCCEWTRAFNTEEAAKTALVVHMRTAGGKPHHDGLVEVLLTDTLMWQLVHNG